MSPRINTETAGDLSLALPPTSISKTLTKFTKASLDSQGTLNNLLQAPFLHEIKIPAASTGVRRGAKGTVSTVSVGGSTTIYPLISDTVAKLTAVQVIDVGIARQLLGYSRTFPVVAGLMPRGQAASSLLPMVARYVEEANAKSVQSKKFFNRFHQTIEAVSTTIGTLDNDIAETKQQVMQVEEQLEDLVDSAGANILTILRNGIGKYFDTASYSGYSFLAGLAALFKMTVVDVESMITRSGEISELQKLIGKLEEFQIRVKGVRTAIANLGHSMSMLMRASVSIMSIWFEISRNLQTLASSESGGDPFCATDIELLKMTWKDVEQQAQEFTEAVSNVSATAVDALRVENETVVSRSLFPSTNSSTKLSTAEEEALALIKPDPDVAARLADMTEKSGKIVASFNGLLQTPFLDSLKVSTSAVSGSNSDGTGGDEAIDDGIDLETLTLTYLQRYQKLQAETVPVARDLYGYAMLQQNLLPMLQKTLPVGAYVDVNLKLIDDFRVDAEKLHALHNKFQQDWNNAINMVIRAIDEQKVKMVGFEKQIEDLVKIKRDLTIGAVFAILGAVLFTAAAFLIGGLFFTALATAGAIAAAAGALGTAVGAGVLIGNVVKMNESISAFEQSLDTARETVQKLEAVLPVMQEIQDLLETVTLVWNSITNKLTVIHTNVDTWTALLLFPESIDTMAGIAIEDWKEIAGSVLAYVAVISDANPSA